MRLLGLRLPRLAFIVIGFFCILFMVNVYEVFNSSEEFQKAVSSTLNKPDLSGLLSSGPYMDSKNVVSGPADESMPSVGSNGGADSPEAEALKDAQKENALKLDATLNGDLNPENMNTDGASGKDAPVKQEDDSLADSLDKASGGEGAKDTAGVDSNDIDNLNIKKGGPTAAKGSCGEKHQFVIVVDAGSSGSRVHVYEFDVCSQPPVLVHETFHMLKPGLSSFDADAEAAAHSLDPLLNIAVEAVPDDVKSCTPITVKATAGLRLLGDEKSTAILNAVSKHLTDSYPFAVVTDGVQLMGGDEEGVFAWVTTNYLLGKIGAKSKLDTSAVFDLGGGSTQIVFEPTYKVNEQMVPGEHKYELNFGDFSYTLYQFSHLGFGLNEARNAINSLLVEEAIQDNKIVRGDTLNPHRLVSPCLPPDATAPGTKVKMPSGFEYTIEFYGTPKSSGLQCRFLAEQILNKDTKCDKPPCSVNGAHQPSLVHTFKETNDIFAFSYFYDRTQPLGLPSTFTLKELKDLSKVVCKGPVEWMNTFKSKEPILNELRNDPLYCQDLTYQVALLQTGYDIPLHRKLKTTQKIANNEIGWCLGAALPLIKSDSWTCRA